MITSSILTRVFFPIIHCQVQNERQDEAPIVRRVEKLYRKEIRYELIEKWKTVWCDG